MKIVTNSQTIEEPKDPDKSNIFALYKLFASKDEIEELRQRYLAGGMGWGDAKKTLFEKMNEYLTPMRDKYYELMENKDYIDEVLEKGAEKARKIVSKKIEKIHKIIGV
jgi:tryptophanyl-tRNA synthetase